MPSLHNVMAGNSWCRWNELGDISLLTRLVNILCRQIARDLVLVGTRELRDHFLPCSCFVPKCALWLPQVTACCHRRQPHKPTARIPQDTLPPIGFLVASCACTGSGEPCDATSGVVFVQETMNTKIDSNGASMYVRTKPLKMQARGE